MKKQCNKHDNVNAPDMFALKLYSIARICTFIHVWLNIGWGLHLDGVHYRYVIHCYYNIKCSLCKDFHVL